MNKNIVLIVHQKFNAFQWSKVILTYFYKQSTKNNIDIRIINDPEELLEDEYNGFAIILGVEPLWIEGVIKQIINPNVKIILLNGNTDYKLSEISHIKFNQCKIIEQSLSLLKSKNRTKTAFFGVNKNDTSDMEKAAIFASLDDEKNIYYISDKVSECFECLLEKIDEYDSVICANDIMSVYFCKRCRELNIDIPRRLFVIGNGDLWIAEHSKTPISSASYNMESIVRTTLRMIKNSIDIPIIDRFDIIISSEIIDRASTAGDSNNSIIKRINYWRNEDMSTDISFEMDEEIEKIKNMDRVLSGFSNMEWNIIKLLFTDAMYEEISDTLFVTLDAVKYHIRKIYKGMNVNNRKELCEILNSYNIDVDSI